MVAWLVRRSAPRVAVRGARVLVVVGALALTACGGGSDGAAPCEIGACPPALTLEITANDGSGAVKEVAVSGADFACSEVPGATVCTSVDGSAGNYHLTIAAPGFASTTIDTTVDANPERCSCGYFPATVAVQLGRDTCDARPAVAADSAVLSLAGAEPGSSDTESEAQFQRLLDADRPQAVTLAAGGGFLVAAWAWAPSYGSWSTRLITTDAWGLALQARDLAYFRACTAHRQRDGGYLVAGSLESTFLFAYYVRVDPDGSLHAFDELVGGQSFDDLCGVYERDDGRLLMAGVYGPWSHVPPESQVPTSMLLVATDSTGHAPMRSTYGDGDRWSGASAIAATAGGGAVLVGWSHETLQAGTASPWSTKLYVQFIDADGVATTSNTYCGSDVGSALAVTVLDDGDLLVAGDVAPPPDGEVMDSYVARVDASGSVIWSRVLPGVRVWSSTSLRRTADGAVAFVGSVAAAGRGTDGFLAKLTVDGRLIWAKAYGGVADDELRSLAELPDGGFVAVGTLSLVGTSAASSEPPRAWLVRTDAEGRSGPLPVDEPTR